MVNNDVRLEYFMFETSIVVTIVAYLNMVRINVTLHTFVFLMVPYRFNNDGVWCANRTVVAFGV